MANFELRELRIVNPRDSWPNEAARASAALAVEVIDGASPVYSVAAAIADLNYVAATTARGRFLAKPVLAPDGAAAALFERHRGEYSNAASFSGKSGPGLKMRTWLLPMSSSPRLSIPNLHR